MLGFDRFQFDGDFLARDDVDSEVNVTCDEACQMRLVDEEIEERGMRTKRTGTDLLAKPIFSANTKV